MKTSATQLFALLVVIWSAVWSSTASADFSYTLAPQKNYVGSVEKIGDTWQFITCDGTALDLIDGAALTFRQDLTCKDKKSANAPGNNGASGKGGDYVWVPTDTSSCGTGTGPNPNPSVNDRVNQLVQAWNSLNTESTGNGTNKNGSSSEYQYSASNIESSMILAMGADHSTAISEMFDNIPPKAWHKPLLEKYLKDSSPKYYGGMTIGSMFNASSVADCYPNVRDPDNCSNCSQRLKQFLDSEPDWKKLFYTDNQNFIARAASAIKAGQPDYNDEAASAFADFGIRRIMTKELIYTLGTRQP